jgi:hypothetical protein
LKEKLDSAEAAAVATDGELAAIGGDTDGDTDAAGGDGGAAGGDGAG